VFGGGARSTPGLSSFQGAVETPSSALELAAQRRLLIARHLLETNPVEISADISRGKAHALADPDRVQLPLVYKLVNK
jgi:hypothetical protein